MARYSHYGDCPNCGVAWGYEQDGQQYSHLVGRSSWELDRVVEWQCPACDARFAREDVGYVGGGGDGERAGT
jgi:hypothetical protein